MATDTVKLTEAVKKVTTLQAAAKAAAAKIKKEKEAAGA